MGDMAKKALTRAGDILVFFPLVHSIATVLYFTFLSGKIRLSDVFPWLFWFYFPALLVVLFFIVTSMIHLFSGGSADRARGKVLWVLLFILAPALALPSYRFTRMRSILCHVPP